MNRENFIEVSGNNLEDAILEAKIKLAVTSDQIDYEVVQKESGGFLGLGSKKAIIKAWIKGEGDNIASCEKKEDDKQVDVYDKNSSQKEEKVNKSEREKPDLNEIGEKGKKFLDDIKKIMDNSATITYDINEEENLIVYNIEGDNSKKFIGIKGQVIDSLQYLTSIIANDKKYSYVRIKVDSANYKERRKKTLENLAFNMARKAVRYNRTVTLEPMNAYERRIIHEKLQDDFKVTTESEGVDPLRRVVIKPIK